MLQCKREWCGRKAEVPTGPANHYYYVVAVHNSYITNRKTRGRTIGKNYCSFRHSFLTKISAYLCICTIPIGLLASLCVGRFSHFGRLFFVSSSLLPPCLRSIFYVSLYISRSCCIEDVTFVASLWTEVRNHWFARRLWRINTL